MHVHSETLAKHEALPKGVDKVAAALYQTLKHIEALNGAILEEIKGHWAASKALLEAFLAFTEVSLLFPILWESANAE